VLGFDPTVVDTTVTGWEAVFFLLKKYSPATPAITAKAIINPVLSSFLAACSTLHLLFTRVKSFMSSGRYLLFQVLFTPLQPPIRRVEIFKHPTFVPSLSFRQ
jgi:hypothetical protein